MHIPGEGPAADDTRDMSDADYITHLYDRAARRYGCASHEEWVREAEEQAGADKAAGKAAGRAWAQVQLNAP